jgi:hypothetical protein
VEAFRRCMRFERAARPQATCRNSLRTRSNLTAPVLRLREGETGEGAASNPN